LAYNIKSEINKDLLDFSADIGCFEDRINQRIKLELESMEQKRIEGLWDCVFCDSKAIKARFASCPSCGRARGIDTIFYLPDDTDAATLTKEEAAKTSNGPDWLCDYCGAYNRCDIMVCKGCGSDKKESKTNYGILHKLTGKLFKKNR